MGKRQSPSIHSIGVAQSQFSRIAKHRALSSLFFKALNKLENGFSKLKDFQALSRAVQILLNPVPGTVKNSVTPNMTAHIFIQCLKVMLSDPCDITGHSAISQPGEFPNQAFIKS